MRFTKVRMATVIHWALVTQFEPDFAGLKISESWLELPEMKTGSSSLLAESETYLTRICDEELLGSAVTMILPLEESIWLAAGIFSTTDH